MTSSWHWAGRDMLHVFTVISCWLQAMFLGIFQVPLATSAVSMEYKGMLRLSSQHGPRNTLVDFGLKLSKQCAELRRG